METLNRTSESICQSRSVKDSQEMQSSGQYGLPDMQEFLLTAGGASHHMFAAATQAQQDAARPQLHQHHQLHQSLKQQQQQAAEILELYHRQGVQEQHGLHHSQVELHRTQGLFSLYHLQQQQQQQQQQQAAADLSLHLPLTHQMSLGSDSSEMAPLVARTPAASHHHAPQFKPLIAASRESFPTVAGAGDDYAEFSAEDGDKGAGGSRWPREETLALLRIRSEMDALFRDSGLKGPLWDEVSRKLYDAGYQRSAKKCKEKFENVHKYYKKTKDVKAERQDGKTYRFRTELEAIYAASQEHDMVECEGATASAVVGIDHDSAALLAPVAASGDTAMLEGVVPLQIMRQGPEISNSPNSSSSTSCDEEYEKLQEEAATHGGAAEQQSGRKRKRSSWRSMRAFFEDLAKQLMERQDALHKKFLETIERRDEERLRREETYKRQEMARLNRELELRAQEHALAATRDAALVAFLQKVTGETLHLPEMPPVVPSATTATAMGEAAVATTPSVEDQLEREGFDANTRRWPKVEVLALIRIRTSLEPRFQEAGPKAQLWEEVSASMGCLGFIRSAKRCKEKWENINKYFRKTKDNACRKRPDGNNSKTCPYFHQLEVLYERGILASPNSSSMNKSAKLDGQQHSEDLLESSKEDSQQTHSGNPDHGGANMAINVATGGRENNAAGCSTTSSTGTTTQLCMMNGQESGRAADHDAKPFSECGLINVNSQPAPHLSLMQEQQQQQLLSSAHEDHVSGKVNGGMPVEGFVREMIDQQHQLQHQHHHHHHQKLADEYERLEHARDVQMREQERMQQQQQQEMSRLAQERSHRDNVTLMALVHKLAAGGGHPSEFDLSSPASTE